VNREEGEGDTEGDTRYGIGFCLLGRTDEKRIGGEGQSEENDLVDDRIRADAVGDLALLLDPEDGPRLASPANVSSSETHHWSSKAAQKVPWHQDDPSDRHPS
jgi:hypothetical protein